jgi:hypothetical protein
VLERSSFSSGAVGIMTGDHCYLTSMLQVRLMEEKGYVLGNIDCTIIAQRPKLSPHKVKCPSQSTQSSVIEGLHQYNILFLI